MKSRNRYRVENANQEPFYYTTKANGRIDQTLRALIKGPFPCPSRRRVSDHVFRLRQAGLNIETEMREQRQEGAEKFGIYHLVSRVTPVSGGAQ